MRKTTIWMTVAMISGMTLMVRANETGPTPERVEVHHSMVGYRDTLVFYTFTEQRTIMVLGIHNEDETFPVTGKVYLFDKTTSPKGLRKWVNNRHSDALFVDAATPRASKELPSGFCKVIARKQTGTSENPGPGNERFKNFEVTFSIEAQAIEGGISLPAFTDTARVYVKSQP